MAAISVDDSDKSRALAARLALSLPILSDVDRAVTRAFGVEDADNEIAWPAVFIVDAGYHVRWRWLADDFKLRPSSKELLDALDRAATPATATP